MRIKRFSAFLITMILVVQSMLTGIAPVNAQTVIDVSELISETAPRENEISTNTAEIIYSGTSGDLEWRIDSDGLLLITGNGNYENSNSLPWHDYFDEIYSAKIKTSGMTYMGSMFSGCCYLESIDFSEMDAGSIANSALQTNVFQYCEALKCVIAPSEGFVIPIALPSVVEGKYWSYNDMETPMSNIKDAGKYELKSEMEGKTYIYSGKDGDIYWDIDATGVLTISGNGACVNKDWLVYREKVKSAVIKSTSIDYASYLFTECTNLESFSIDTTFTSGSVAGMFYGCSSIKEIDLTAMLYPGMNMSYMFANCDSLEKITFSDSFDTRYVEYMEGMFQHCYKLSDLDLAMFDTTKVTDMSNMFYNCQSLPELDLSSFDTSNVTSCYWMFKGCRNLSKLNICSFNVFYFSINDIWEECYRLSYINAPENTSGMTWTLPFGTWTYQPSGSNVTEITGEGVYTRKEQCCGIDGDLTWEIENKQLTITGNGDFEQALWLKYCDDYETAKVSVTGITSMSEMFFGCEKLQNIDFTGTNTSQVQDFFETFGHCTKLSGLDLSGFDTTNAINMWGMFYGCENLEQLNLKKFNTSNVTNMMGMFCGCENLKTLDVSSFNTEKVWNMSGMFQGCKKLEQIDITNFDTRSLLMEATMFSLCGQLKYVNAPDNKSDKPIWIGTTSENKWIYQPTGETVTEIKKAGMYVRSDVYVPLVSAPESTGTTMNSSDLTTTTGKVPENSSFTVTSSDPKNPTVAFDGVADEDAPAVDIPETITYNGVTYQVTSVSIDDYTSKTEQAKYEVTGNDVNDLTVSYKAPTNTKKTNAKIPDYSTYKGVKFKVTSVSAKAFKGNKKLKNISIASSITIIGNDAFNGCSNLKTVTVGKSLKTIGKNAFKNCKKLSKVTIKSKKLATIGNSAFYKCTSLKNLSFSSTKLSKIDKNAFYGCKKLTKITIKSKKLKTVGKNAIKGVNKNCTIKVPKAKLKAYKKLFKNKGLKKVKVTK